jgi:hypothetical protein
VEIFEPQGRTRKWLYAAAVLVVAVVVAIACDTSSVSSQSNGEDASTQGGSDGVVACPKTLPDAGVLCALPQGTTCSFGNACDGLFATCSGGAWVVPAATPVPSGCPETMPEAGAACPDCFSADASCLYENGCAFDASATLAACLRGAWTMSSVACTVDAGTTEDAAPEDGSAGEGGEDAGDAGDASDAGDAGDAG